MHADIVNQFAGRNTVESILRPILADTAFTRLRVLVAFCKGSGVGLLNADLAAFLDRGGQVDAIVGLDLNGTSPDALRGLVDMGAQVRAFGVRGMRTFHPKVWLFTDELATRYAVLIGSANWTGGGLDSNFEAGVLITLSVDESEQDAALAGELESLWRTYAEPAEPMTEAHLRVIDRGELRRLAAGLPADSTPSPDESTIPLSDQLFGPLPGQQRRPVRARRVRSTTHSTERPAITDLPSSLLLEAGRETAGGREIQLPLESLSEYFGITREDAYYMTLNHADGTIERNRPLAIYSQNSTFRISSSNFLAISQDERPMIVRLDRTGNDTFDVTLLRRETPEFAQAQDQLDRGGGDTKRWGLIP